MTVAPPTRRWLTPRFPLEMAAASLATFALVLLVGELGRGDADPPLVQLKTAAKAPRIDLPPSPSDEARTDAFIERFALAHVSPPLPESALADPGPAKPPFAQRLSQPALSHEKPRGETATVKPPARPQMIALAEPPPVAPAPSSPKKVGFSIPVVSALVAKLPTGRDIMNGVGAAGRRVASIFGG